jgi:HKD family nuclease
MQLVNNGHGDNHGTALARVLEEAGRISVAVAFLIYGGAKIIGPLLETRLKAGATVEAFVGTDFYITEPKALTHLLAIAKRFEGFEIFLAGRAKSSFHPKLYVGRTRTQVRCLVGSANLTGGAMATNEETSLQVTVEPNEVLSTDLDATFTRYRGDDRFQELDDLVLGQYASRHKQAERLRRKLEKELETSQTSQFDLRRLDEYHGQYLADDDLSEALERRREDRSEALKVQRSIARLSGTSRPSKAAKAAFSESFGDLISSKGQYRHLWHSGDIHRRGSEALQYPRRTIDLFAEGRKAAKLGPEAGYEKLRRIGLDIPGVGVNMITEILCTFAPDRFAVFNGNTSGALAAIGVAAPRKPTLTGLSGKRYAGLCATIDALRERIDGADFTDADAFLNWLYFRTKPAKSVVGG